MNQTIKDGAYAALKLGFASGGPIGALVLRYSHLSSDDWNLWLQAGLWVIPPTIAGGMEWWDKRKAGKIAAAAKLSPAEVQAALPQLSDETKALIANSVPGVATVVLKDGVTNGLAKLANNPAYPNIVSETQNEVDAKLGTKVKV